MFGIWRLQLLREVALRGTLRDAAAAMSISPSAVSQQLAVLEQEAGLPLLEKSGRGVRLTGAGEALVRHADAITAAMAAAESDIARLRETVSGTLRITAFPTAAKALMPAVMAHLGSIHPDLRLMLRDLEAYESLASLEMDEIDLALLDEYGEPHAARAADLHTQVALEDPMMLATAHGRLPPGPARLADVRDDPWIMDTERSLFFGAVTRACRVAGFEPHVRSSCKDFSVIIALVEAGLGVAILPGLAVRDLEARLDLHPVDGVASRRVVIACRAGRRHHPAVASAIDAVMRFGEAYRPTLPA